MFNKLSIALLVGLVVILLIAEGDARKRRGRGRKHFKRCGGAVCAEVDRATGDTIYDAGCFNGFFENNTAVFECVNSTKPYSRKVHTSDMFHCVPVRCVDELDCAAGDCRMPRYEEDEGVCDIDRQYRNLKKFVSSCRVEDVTGTILSEGKCANSKQVCSEDDHEVMTVPIEGVDTSVRAYRCQRVEEEVVVGDDDVVVVAP